MSRLLSKGLLFSNDDDSEDENNDRFSSTFSLSVNKNFAAKKEAPTRSTTHFEANTAAKPQSSLASPAGDELLEEEEEDQFGFGSYKDTFLSPEEIEQTAKKLGEDAVQENKCETLLCDLMKFEGNSSQTSERCIGDAVRLSSNHIVLGIGCLGINHEAVLWHGVISPLGSARRTFSFPLSSLSQLRMKDLVEEVIFLVMFCMNDTFFCEFGAVRQELASSVYSIIKENKSALKSACEQEANKESSHTSPCNQAEEMFSRNTSRERAVIAGKYEPQIAAIQREIAALQRKLVTVQEDYEAELRLLSAPRRASSPPPPSPSCTPEHEHTPHCPSMAPADGGRGEEESANVCCICYDGPDDTLLQPCTHRCCWQCAGRILAQDPSLCPWDRSKVTARTRTSPPLPSSASSPPSSLSLADIK